MSRIRSFDLPHKALRNVLSKVSFQLGSTTMTDAGQLQALKDRAHELFTMLNEHAHTENEQTLHHLETRVPGSGDHDRADHERLESIQDALQSRISHLSGNEDADSMHQLYLDFSKFHSEYLEHIYMEETVTEVLLQQHFTDEELLQHRMAIMQSIPFPVMLLWMKYAVPAQREEQNVGMLAGFKANAPAQVFEQLLTAIRSEMDATAYANLLSLLS